MKLIVDAGGSKTEWRTIDANHQISQGKLSGFNPLIQPKSDCDLLVDELINQLKGAVKEVHYYGAGIINDEIKGLVKSSFETHLKDCEVFVNNDLLGAARAVCGREHGIACILGTGSNSCYFDGQSIVEHVPPLGYLLGDEGSGMALGKAIVTAYLRDQLPKDLKTRFVKRFDDSSSELLNRLYQEARPNTFLAGFTKFILQNIQHPYIYQMVAGSFRGFFENVLLLYKKPAEQRVHFSGSIAFYFSDVLRAVASEYNIRIHNIVESPIAGLVLFHSSVDI
ncbi:MAG: N-acetylglucosamine kinase [Cyclobacteriaceae bacterium]